MARLTRRSFLASAAAASAVRTLPPIAAGVARAPATKRVVEVIYDKGLGMMRAVERVVAR